MAPVIREDFIQERSIITVGVQSSRVRSIKRTKERQLGIRAYDGRAVSIAGGLGFPDEDKLWRKAAQGLDDGIPYPLLPQKDHAEEEVTPGEVPGDRELLEEVEIILSHFRHRFPQLILSGSVSSVNYNVAIRNETGLDLGFSSPVFRCGFSFRHRDSLDSMDGFTGSYGVNYSRTWVLKDLESICEPFSRDEYRGAPGRMPVVFAMGMERALLSELVKNLYCSWIHRGSSLFSGLMNSEVLNREFTVAQCPDNYNTGLKFFDKEGTVNPHHSLDLIRGGVPLRTVTDRLTALEYDCENSGSAFKGSYDTLPSVGIPYVRISDTGKSLGDILQGREALLLVLPGGGGVSDNGRFSTTIQLGYMMKNGKITSRISGGSVSGSLLEMFGPDYMGCSTDSMLAMTHSPGVVCMMNVDPGATTGSGVS